MYCSLRNNATEKWNSLKYKFTHTTKRQKFSLLHTFRVRSLVLLFNLYTRRVPAHVQFFYRVCLFIAHPSKKNNTHPPFTSVNIAFSLKDPRGGSRLLVSLLLSYCSCDVDSWCRLISGDRLTQKTRVDPFICTHATSSPSGSLWYL